METHERTTEKAVIYYVNDAVQETKVHEIKVRAILTNAHFTPPEEYELERNAGHKVFKDLDEVIELHENEHFTALFVGPTPTS